MLAAGAEAALPEAGISEALAAERSAAITELRYELSLTVPDRRDQPLVGREVLRFRLRVPHPVVLDFAQPLDRITAISGDDGPVAFTGVNGHLIIPASATRPGENAFTIEFLAGDDSLNRNDEFLYSLFVPARAHLAFPCFDQPDLKARFTLTLDVPTGWQAVGNGAELERAYRNGREIVRFAETQPLPTYLFSFVAGKFTIEASERDGRSIRIVHRETDAAKVAHNRDAIFNVHAAALSWLEAYTGIAYPFGKFDVVLIPSFQFGGMEHPGAILYNAAALMLDATATQNQLLDRASVISHETAHMWFGDLVTMKWFDDVWMKEVFANFMAAKIVNPSYPDLNHDLRFLLAHYPDAYEVDRTSGTNAIRQPLANLQDAGSLYGSIIYEKAPIVMRQLELIVGEQGLRDGLRAYLGRYAFGNATWRDLVTILDEYTAEDLSAWSRAWVEERGWPRLSVSRRGAADGQLSELTVAQDDPLGRGLVWPQRIMVTVGSGSSVRHVPVFLRGPTAVVPAVRGVRAESYVLVNGGGLGYGYAELDSTSRRVLLAGLDSIPDALTRGAAWITLWENLLEGGVPAAAFVDLALRALPKETDEQNTDRVLAYVTRAFWRHLTAAERDARTGRLETVFREGLKRAGKASQKAAWFGAVRDVALSRETLDWIERVWRREEKVPGLPFAETDEIAMALELAVRGGPTAAAILEQQRERIQNPDRKARFEFVMPALSTDPLVREQSFARFAQMENRRREPWVLEAQRYLNHPLRAEHARRFVRPSLELLLEVKRTGDIFFPKRWMDATLAGHRSREVAADVQDFLARELTLPQRLRWVVLSSADELFRAAR